MVLCTADGAVLSTDAAAQSAAAPATAAPATIASDYGAIRTTADKVNLRVSPAGASQEQIPINTTLSLTGAPVTQGRYTWYPVTAASGKKGYLRSDCVEVVSTGTQTFAGATATPAPAANLVYGYLQVTKSGVNLRRSPNGAVIDHTTKGSVLPITGPSKSDSGYTWYPVTANNQACYIRGDCVSVLSETQVASYLAGTGIPVETATPIPAQVNYVQTTMDKVYLRKAATKDSSAVTQVAKGTVLSYSATTTAGGSRWYNVVYNNQKLWILGSCVRELSVSEYNAYVASNGGATPQPAVDVGYVITVKGGVNIRKTAGGNNILGKVSRGEIFSFTTTSKSGSYTWYQVRTNYGTGWIRSDCVEECQANGSALPTTAPVVNGNTATAGTTTTVVEANYTTLRLGSTGTEVSRLAEALREQGYYTGPATTEYTSALQSAVVLYQQSAGLTADGIAGNNTLHSLYGTVPVGSASTVVDASDLSMVLYPAEKIDWFTGGIQELWPRGANVKVYDVKTGIVWWAHRWAGAYHADVEPLTAADTARLCQIYGVSKASQITSKNLWQRRPCLVTIGNRTFACSLYGEPHNYGADTIPNNNMDGQVCLHFTNSKTHGSKKVDAYHKAAIQYAWENAPNGHK